MRAELSNLKEAYSEMKDERVKRLEEIASQTSTRNLKT